MSSNWACIFSLAALASISAAAQDSPVENQMDSEDTTISVKSFGRGKVIGHLGHPLGTVVRVTGVAVDGETTRSKADAGKTLLRVETANGAKLERPFDFKFHRAAKGIARPLPGQRFDYYVHEYGVFDGIVEDFEIETLPVANDGFHYRPQITILKSLTVSED
jgi:hypothetical protein